MSAISTAKKVQQYTLIGFVLASILTVSACRTEELRVKNLKLIDEAAMHMESNPELSLKALEGINSAYLEQDEYYYYQLLSTRISSMLGADISDMGDNVKAAVIYFENKKDAKRVAFSYYVQSKVCEAKNDNAYALGNYINVDYWAAKADYSIPNFVYISIPYNIALHHKRIGSYHSSIEYLNKAILHADSTRHPVEKMLLMHSLELMGINYMYLSKSDSAFYYYDEAEQLAEQMEDRAAKQRITGNQIEMLSILEGAELSETLISKLLKQYNNTNDSAFISITNLSLARIYTKTNRLKQAYQCIDKALAYIDENDFENQLMMYEQLVELAGLDATHGIEAEYTDFLQHIQNIAKYSPYTKDKELNERLRQKAGELLSESMSPQESLFLTLLKRRSIHVGLVTLAMMAVVAVRIRKKYSTPQNSADLYYEELAIVEYILQAGLKKSIERQLAGYVLRQDSFEGEEMLDCIEMHRPLSEISVLDAFKKKLFGEKYDTPILTELELFVCYLMSTNRYEHWAIASIMNISHEQFLLLILSLEVEIRKAGYRLPLSYRKARRRLGLMPERYLRECIENHRANLS